VASEEYAANKNLLAYEWKVVIRSAGSAYDEYVSDPSHPVPDVSYAATGLLQEYMVSDQRFAAKRPSALQENAPVSTSRWP
jgi:hypothetical protein